jgi:hypothetical protein
MTDLTEITMVAETQDLVAKAIQLQELLDNEKGVVSSLRTTIENQKDVISHLESKLTHLRDQGNKISVERDTIVNLIKTVAGHLVK